MPGRISEQTAPVATGAPEAAPTSGRRLIYGGGASSAPLSPSAVEPTETDNSGSGAGYAAVLDAFINRQSAISGAFRLADGTLTLQDQKVQGQNAVALLTSQTSLTAATTDTTIGLDVGKTGSVDFVMTVKGPVAAPTLNAGRPPGR